MRGGVSRVVRKCVAGIRNNPAGADALWALTASIGIDDSNYMEMQLPQELSQSKQSQLRRNATMKQHRDDAKAHAAEAAAKAGAQDPYSTFACVTSILHGAFLP